MENQKFISDLKLFLKSKVTFAIIFAAIFIIACQQNNQPSPSGSSSTTTGGTTTGGGNTPGTIAAQQQMIQGNWILRQTQTFQLVTINGVTKDSMLKYENHYSPSTCFLDLTNTPSTVTGYFVANGSLSCNPGSLWWRISTLNQLDWMGAIFIIEHLTTDSLVLYQGGSPIKIKYILNKTGIQTGLNSLEMQIAKNWNLVKTEINATTTTTAYNSAGAFLNQWNYPTFGWKISGFTPLASLSWQVVEGRFSISGQHYKIDTLNSNKFVITSLSPSTSPYRYTFQ